MDRIDINYGTLVDSIRLSDDGSFAFTLQSDTSDFLLYKFVLAQKGKHRTTTLASADDNYFLLANAENCQLELTAHSDSLYYSVKIAGGSINQSLLVYRDYTRPIQEILRNSELLIQDYSDKAKGYQKEIVPRLMDQIEEFKRSVTHTLDTASHPSVVLAGLIHLNSAYLGMLPSDVIKKYLPKIEHLDLPIVKNALSLAESIVSNRRGLILPDLAFKDRNGDSLSLYDVTKKLTVIDFWASWCNPCRKANRNELPDLYEILRKDPEKQLISISIDTNQEQWKMAMDADKVTWPQYVDSGGAYSKLLSVYAVPLYLVLDEQKRIIYETISSHLLLQFLSNVDSP
ncbi:MAG TPA: TlpA disulfide reductase family protein [Cyclobacteriaceae bacterium]|jgi:thiol-disulfide isomerase/thioredoxin